MEVARRGTIRWKIGRKAIELRTLADKLVDEKKPTCEIRRYRGRRGDCID